MLIIFNKYFSLKSIILFLIPLQIYSQSNVDSVKSNIIGKLQDSSQYEVIYASVVLIKNDSTLVNSAISDTDGKFKFFKIEAGTYKLIIKHIEFETYTSDSFEVLNNEKVIPAITLNPAKNTLDEVVITQKKALIQVKADKIIFNVASSPSASGTNGLDLLKKLPGVTVDMDDNISLLGKSGVQIYINDVPSRLSGRERFYTVVGYICETDTFGNNRRINEINEGDMLCFKNAGAYCYSMASNYNSRYRPAEVLWHNNKAHLIRKRETFEDILKNQIEIDFSDKRETALAK